MKVLLGSIVIATEQLIHTIRVTKAFIITRLARVPAVGVMDAETLECQRLKRMPHPN